MMDSNISRPELFGMIAKMVLVSFVGFYSMKYIMNQIDPMSKAKKAAREKVCYLKLYLQFNFLYFIMKSNLFVLVF